MFWLGVGVLCLAAAAFCLPLLRAGAGHAAAPSDVDSGGDEAAARAQQVALYRAFERELSADTTLAPAQRERLLAERGRQLLGELDGVGASACAAPTAFASPRWLAALLVGGLIAGALATYSQLGLPEAEPLASARQVLLLPPPPAGDAAAQREFDAHIATLRQRVARVPTDGGAAYLLGMAELKLGRFAAAQTALDRAAAGGPADPILDLARLQARFLAGGGRLDAEGSALGQALLANAPNQALVLEMLAQSALRDGDFPLAIGYLNRALAAGPPAERRQAFEIAHAAARQALGEQTGVRIELQLQQPPPSGATLFAIARPVGGGMPYAVVKRPAHAAPATIVLDDAVSMSPANPLSAATRVDVSVRLSLSGSVRAGPGDWEWRAPDQALVPGQQLSLSAALAPPG
ncbi:MAG: c-type cytochrome biogenesis protein CcmI [Pseudomonadota bacterium]